MGTNSFAAVAEFWSPLAMKVYIVLMILAVIIGTLFDVWHKGSAIYFAQRREKSKALARNPLGSGEAISLALATIAEAAVSGEFDNLRLAGEDMGFAHVEASPLTRSSYHARHAAAAALAPGP